MVDHCICLFCFFSNAQGENIFCRIRGYISTVRKNSLSVIDTIQAAFEGNPFIPVQLHNILVAIISLDKQKTFPILRSIESNVLSNPPCPGRAQRRTKIIRNLYLFSYKPKEAREVFFIRKGSSQQMISRLGERG